ncbi:MAG: L,D-transpeptidase [Eggerthella lenta]
MIIDKGKLQEAVTNGVGSAQTGDMAIPCEQEAGAYDGLHGRDWGKRYVDVDLTEQHARFYDDEGSLAWESDVVTGTPDGEHDTPEGVYVINGKESPSKLIGQMKPETGEPEYQTEVKAWMPFVDNYIGFHDADWQPAFGDRGTSRLRQPRLREPAAGEAVGCTTHQSGRRRGQPLVGSAAAGLAVLTVSKGFLTVLNPRSLRTMRPR